MKYKFRLSWFIISLGLFSGLLILTFLFILIFNIILNLQLQQYLEYAKDITKNISFYTEYLIKTKNISTDELSNLINIYNENLENKKFYITYHKIEDIKASMSENDLNNILNNPQEYMKSNDNDDNEYILPQIIYNKNNDVIGALLIHVKLKEVENVIAKKLIMILYSFLIFPILGSIILSGILVFYIKKGLFKLKKLTSKINSISDLNQFEFNTIDFKFFEFNEIKEELNRLLSKIKKIAIDKEILRTEMKLLEEFIITSEAIQDWIDYITRILTRVSNIIDFYFFYAIFKEKEDLIVIYIFHRFNEIDGSKNIELKIKDQIKNSDLFNENFEIIFEYKKISARSIDFIESNEFETITKAILIEKPLIGGILGVGVDISTKEDEVKKLAFESLLATMINFIGSIKAINVYTKELEYYATRDPLTSLYNQRVFWDLLYYEVERARKHKYSFGLIVIDLDNFKIINDNYGHHFGDLFLKKFGSLLDETFRKEDIISRYGGDEFVIIMPYADQSMIEIYLNQLLNNINNFYLTSPDSQLVKITASIGVSIFPEHSDNAKELFLITDETMYTAKQEGKNCYRIFNKKISTEYEKKDQSLAKLLLDILDNKNVIPYFQPIVYLNNNQIFAYEILMRINDLKTKQIISAGRFVSMAEKMGIIQNLDLMLIEEVLKYNEYFKRNQIKLFFNLSPRSINSAEFIHKLDEILKYYNFYDIVFEITEREAIKDLNLLLDFIVKLKRKGIQFAIDDFGSGFSSYIYIKEIPIDYIKIEGNFIRTMLSNNIDKVFIESIVKIAKILNIKTIAEYVENNLVYNTLKNTEIDLVQGYFISKPAPISEITNIEIKEK